MIIQHLIFVILLISGETIIISDSEDSCSQEAASCDKENDANTKDDQSKADTEITNDQSSGFMQIKSEIKEDTPKLQSVSSMLMFYTASRMPALN